MIFDWPGNLVPQDITIDPPSKTAGLSTSLSDFVQVVPVIRPPFMMTLDFGNLFQDEVIAWRAMMALFEGRANQVRVPLFDLWFRASDAQIHAGSVSFSDGSSFSDGALWLTDDLSGVTVTGAQGDRIITADFGAYGQLLQGGLYFGLGEHPYIAQQVWWAGSVATISCSPTLRTAYVAEPLKLKPTMVARKAEDLGGRLKLNRGRFGGPSLDLVEQFV